MKKAIGVLLLFFAVCLFCACPPVTEDPVAKSITVAEAKEITEGGKPYILLDVRSLAEYNSGHIAGAILIPNTEIAARAEAELTDKEIIILAHCGAGARSKAAAEILIGLGYKNVYYFGGIADWPGGLVT